jgi:hypothetical protein
MAAVTRTEFLERYPEFNTATASAALIDAKLAEADRRTNDAVFPTAELAKDATMLRAATLLLRSPLGKQMRQTNPDQVFTWEYELRMLQRSATMGLRVF